MAEANRDNGFRVLSLGYVAGSSMSTETLFGRSTRMEHFTLCCVYVRVIVCVYICV